MAVVFPPYSSGGGGGGAVDSVQGKTGVVVLTADDVDAVPTVATASVVYANNGSGVPTPVSYGSTPTNGRIAAYGAGGVMSVAAPSNGGHATNKTYVDGLTNALDARLDALEAANFVTSSDGSVEDMRAMTAAEYTALATKDAKTYYATT